MSKININPLRLSLKQIAWIAQWMNTTTFRLQVCCYWLLVHNLTLSISATTLSNIMEERQRSKPDVQLATMKSVSRHRCYSAICLIETLQEYINAFTIEKTTYPTCWRILRGINRVEKQELVMHIQGIICLKDLPPLQLG